MTFQEFRKMVHEYALTHDLAPPPESMMKELYKKTETRTKDIRQFLDKRLRMAFSRIKERLAEDIIKL